MNSLRIAWVAVQELFYEKVFYLLLCFVGVSLVLSLLLGQLSYSHQTKITVDFLLGAIQISLTLLCVFMGIRMFQQELTLGSVAMILSKPISRSAFLLGKYLGQVAVQGGIIFLMACFTVLFTARSLHVEAASLSIFQTCALIFFEVSVLTAITYCFAVNAGAVTTAIATLGLFALGHLRGPISEDWGKAGEENLVWQAAKVLIPDLELFNMKAMGSYGYSLDWITFGWAALYGLVCIAFFLAIACVTFQRKDILT